MQPSEADSSMQAGAPAQAGAAEASKPQRKSWFSGRGLWNAFKTFAILFSFTINFVVLVALVLILPNAARFYSPLRNELLAPVVGGLYKGFGGLNDARIQQTIAVKDTVPAKFDLPLDQTTTVELVEPVPLALPAVVDLGNNNQLNATVYLSLPPGTKLPVHMNLTVPVSQTIPVNLNVAVDIPLNKTELGPEVQGFQGLFRPLNEAVQGLPPTWDGLVECVATKGVPADCAQR